MNEFKEIYGIKLFIVKLSNIKFDFDEIKSLIANFQSQYHFKFKDI